jgi:Xaa-Pro aminopeptidase
MFDKKIYIKRRSLLRDDVNTGLILILGNNESPMNYPANPYPFRQDSNFLYFFGIDKPGFTGLIDIDENKDFLFGEDFTIDDIIWMGPQPIVRELAEKVGVKNTDNLCKLKEQIDNAISKGRKIHFLPPYRAENSLEIGRLLGISNIKIKNYASKELIKAVISQRSVKSKEEIAEIEKALDISYEMNMAVMNIAKPGKYERELVGEIEGIISSFGSHYSFPTILTINGETLHNHFHGNKLTKNSLLIIDSGAESPEHYASDITRTLPVGGKFTSEQKDIYEIVLESQVYAIKATKPGEKYRDIHLKVAQVIAQGLKHIGLMKGNVADAVKKGAHALFFPHGLGHMMGLDVHDMEDLGEDLVGYDDTVKRSDQFGLAYLRLARELKPDFVFTVEPGIYFIPALIDQWSSEKKYKEYIDYSKVEKFKGFGGIRIEDDVMITDKGHRVLGRTQIPKSVKEIEDIMI